MKRIKRMNKKKEIKAFIADKEIENWKDREIIEDMWDLAQESYEVQEIQEKLRQLKIHEELTGEKIKY